MLIYRGSGLVNFAQGAIGTLAAYAWSVVATLAGGRHLYVEVATTVTTFLLLGNWLERVGCPGAAARGAALSPHRRP